MAIGLGACLGFGRWTYNMTILRHSLSFGCIRWMVAVIMAILCASPLENVNYAFEHCDQLYLTGMTSRQ